MACMQLNVLQMQEVMTYHLGSACILSRPAIFDDEKINPPRWEGITQTFMGVDIVYIVTPSSNATDDLQPANIG
jgi:hypothetical protein